MTGLMGKLSLSFLYSSSTPRFDLRALTWWFREPGFLNLLLYLSPRIPCRSFCRWGMTHLDAEGRRHEKQNWLRSNGYMLTPVTRWSQRERGESRVQTSLVLLDYINYPSLGEVILNGLTVLWGIWEKSKFFFFKQSNFCLGLFIKLVNSLALKTMALFCDSLVYCP